MDTFSDAEIDTYRCLVCGQDSQHCPGHGDLQPCTECEGWNPKHTWRTSRLGGTITCSECKLLPLDADDYDTTCTPRPEWHEPNCEYVQDFPWVSVFFDQGDESDIVLNLFDQDDGVRLAVEHMSQWDYGDETDQAHTYVHQPAPEATFYNDPDHTAPWGRADDTYEHGNYVMSIGPGRMYVSLNRRRLTKED